MQECQRARDGERPEREALGYRPRRATLSWDNENLPARAKVNITRERAAAVGTPTLLTDVAGMATPANPPLALSSRGPPATTTSPTNPRATAT
ncbi:unnamed protein product, partial [Ectocarpus sp. 12 AP-2014]